MSPEQHDPGLTAFEAELASLQPRADELDLPRLMYLAGRASRTVPTTARRSPSRLVWPMAFSGMSLAAATLLVMLLARPEPTVVERIVRVPVRESVAPIRSPEVTPKRPNPIRQFAPGPAVAPVPSTAAGHSGLLSVVLSRWFGVPGDEMSSGKPK